MMKYSTGGIHNVRGNFKAGVGGCFIHNVLQADSALCWFVCGWEVCGQNALLVAADSAIAPPHGRLCVHLERR